MHVGTPTCSSHSGTISYPLFVHAIQENINLLGLYHTRPEAKCDTNPKD